MLVEGLIDPESSCASELINSTVVPSAADYNDTEVIIHTLKSYGSLFAVSLLLFCVLRRLFPKVYNVRNWVEKYKTPLAADQRGFVSWMWKLFLLTDEEIRDECGMDALCYSRIFSFGIQLSLFGIFHSIWLMPVYGTESVAPLVKNDPIATVSISNIPSGSNRFYGTVVASYCIFGFVMYMTLREFRWFTKTRHGFLKLLKPRNYSVYVRSVPEELLNNRTLQEFFQAGLVDNAVLQAQLAVTVGNLKTLQKQRRYVLNKLERAIDLKAIEDSRDSNGSDDYRRLDGDDENDEIRALFIELEEFNRSVSTTIDQIEQRANVYGDSTNRQDVGRIGSASPEEAAPLLDNDNVTMAGPNTMNGNTQQTKRVEAYGTSKIPSLDVSRSASMDAVSVSNASHHSALDSVADTLADVANTVEEWGEHVVRGTGRALLELLSNEDGRVLSGGFVTFTTLRGVYAALQMRQYPEFYAMKVLEAPSPEDIVWANVGRPHQELKICTIISNTLSVTACFFWTIPMAFIASIANVNGLRKQFPWLDELLKTYPELEYYLNQVAPLLIVAAWYVMYAITQVLTMLEGPISGAVIQARMFAKLYWFQIIQTFFISAISGSIFSVLSDVIATPSCVVQLLATSLPGQSSFFIQIMLVQTFTYMSFELLRITPIFLATMRCCIGPNRTEKERAKTFLGLRPFAEPTIFYHCYWLAFTVLYFMVYFVYATIAPISNYFMLACFVIQKVCILNQLVYIYPPFPDSGGKLWLKFFGFVPWGLIISQVTIIGMLGLKRASTAAAAMIPLFIATLLFTFFVRREHFEMAKVLSAKECAEVDLKHAADGVDWSFLRGQYVQPELKARSVRVRTSVRRSSRHNTTLLLTVMPLALPCFCSAFVNAISNPRIRLSRQSLHKSITISHRMRRNHVHPALYAKATKEREDGTSQDSNDDDDDDDLVDGGAPATVSDFYFEDIGDYGDDLSLDDLFDDANDGGGGGEAVVFNEVNDYTKDEEADADFLDALFLEDENGVAALNATSLTTIDGISLQEVAQKASMEFMSSDLSYFYLRDEFGLSEDVMWKITETAPSVLGLKADTVRNKVEVLQSLMGLAREDMQQIIAAQPTLLHMSAKKNISPTILFVQRQLQVSKKELRTLLLGCPNLLNYSRANLNTKIVQFYQGVMGYSVAETRRLLLKEPKLLEASVKTGLIPRLEFLHKEIQLSLEDLRKIIMKNPRILLMSVDQNLQPKLIFFFILTLRMEPKDISKLLVKYPQILNYNLDNHIQPIYQYFTNTLDVSTFEFARILQRFPRLITYSLANMKQRLGYLRFELGLDAEAIRRILFQSPQIISLSQNNVESTVQFLLEAVAPGATLGGRTDANADKVLIDDTKDGMPLDSCQDDQTSNGRTNSVEASQLASLKIVQTIIAGMPSLLGLNIETSLKPKVDYLRSTMGQGTLSRALLVSPTLLGYSLENRIRLRMEKLLQGGVDPLKIPTAVALKEEAFEAWLVRRTSDAAQRRKEEEKLQKQQEKERVKIEEADASPKEAENEVVIESPRGKNKVVVKDGGRIMQWKRDRNGRP